MEKRRETRIDTEIPAQVRTQSGELIQATIRNIGIGGMYIETARSLRRNSYVVLCTRLNAGHERGVKRFELPAIVTHARPEGAGLMYALMNKEMLVALAEVIGEEPARKSVDHLMDGFVKHLPRASRRL